jgi:NOL1/NOP2/fmu family ribosome biogenesis protein
LASEDERHSLFSYLEDRFGIPEGLFHDYLLFEKKTSWWLLKSVPQVALASQLKVRKVGLKAFKKVGAFIKPSTRMIQVFGPAATKARLEIDIRQLKRLLAGEEIPLDLDLGKGYIILELGTNRILGLGLFIDGKVRSQIPRKELRQAMLRVPPPGSAIVGWESGVDND